MQAEHVLIEGVPVQFLPAYNALADEAIETAATLDYEGVPVRVVRPEYLVALYLEPGARTLKPMTNESRRRPRPSAELIASLREAKADLHRRREGLLLREKVRLVLDLQRICIPLLQRQRPLAPWEHPWSVEP